MCPRSFLDQLKLELFMIVVRLHVSKIEQNIEIEDRVNASMIVLASNYVSFSKPFFHKMSKANYRGA